MPKLLKTKWFEVHRGRVEIHSKNEDGRDKSQDIAPKNMLLVRPTGFEIKDLYPGESHNEREVQCKS